MGVFAGGERKAMESAAAIDPGSYRIRMLLARAWARAGRCDRAIPHATGRPRAVPQPSRAGAAAPRVRRAHAALTPLLCRSSPQRTLRGLHIGDGSRSVVFSWRIACAPSLSAGLIAAAATLAGCGGHAVKIDPKAQPVSSRWNAVLATPAGLAGAIQVRGTGWMAPDPKDSAKAKAHVEIANAAPGGVHPWHVHRGQCGNDMGVLGPADAYKPLKVGGDGEGEGRRRPADPHAAVGNYFVNVHASAQNMESSWPAGTWRRRPD